MKYIVPVEIDAEAGIEAEAHPDKIQEVIRKWEALNPLGFYLPLTRRAFVVIVDVPDEDAMFEALHATWVFAQSYPQVTPVVTLAEFPGLLQRIGVGG